MALTTIINLVLMGIVVICAWQGFKKGIIMGIIGILVIILSLYGAQLLSDTFSYEVIPVLKPFVSGVMDARIEDTAFGVMGFEADENGDYNVSQSLTDMIASMPEAREEICRWAYKDLGIYDAMADDMAKKAVDAMDQSGVSISDAIINILCQSLTWYGGFLLAFILLFTVLTVIVNLPNLSFRLPYVGILNEASNFILFLHRQSDRVPSAVHGSRPAPGHGAGGGRRRLDHGARPALRLHQLLTFLQGVIHATCSLRPLP